jgi:hypothetical protein
LQNLPSLGFSERKNLSASFAVAQDTEKGYNFETVTFLGHARSRKTDKLGGFARGSIIKKSISELLAKI